MKSERSTSIWAQFRALKDRRLRVFCIMIVREVVCADSAKRSPQGPTSPGEIHTLQFSDSGMKKQETMSGKARTMLEGVNTINQAGPTWIRRMNRLSSNHTSLIAHPLSSIFRRAGSAHLAEYPRKMLLSFKAAGDGDIQDTRLGHPQHFLRPLYPSA